MKCNETRIYTVSVSLPPDSKVFTLNIKCFKNTDPKMFKVFSFFVLMQALSLVESCSRRRRPAPQPCSWRTCYHDWRNAYSPSVRPGQCVYQSRASTHLYRTHHGTAPCPGSTSCDWRTQGRTRCK